MKRGRGRPRKNSMTSDLSNTQNSYLEEGMRALVFHLPKQNGNVVSQSFHKIFTSDLQFSTDEDEEFEEVVGEMESVAATLGQGEALARSSQPVNYLPGKINPFEFGCIFILSNIFEMSCHCLDHSIVGGHSEDDSKQAAEAMVQLSGVGFYNQQGIFHIKSQKCQSSINLLQFFLGQI